MSKRYTSNMANSADYGEHTLSSLTIPCSEVGLGDTLKNIISRYFRTFLQRTICIRIITSETAGKIVSKIFSNNLVTNLKKDCKGK